MWCDCNLLVSTVWGGRLTAARRDALSTGDSKQTCHLLIWADGYLWKTLVVIKTCCDYISKPPIQTYPTRRLTGERCVVIPWTVLETFKCKCIKTWFIFTTETWNLFQEIPACFSVLALQVAGMLRDGWAVVAGSDLWGSWRQAASPLCVTGVFLFVLFCSLHNSLAYTVFTTFHLVSKWLLLPLHPTW